MIDETQLLPLAHMAHRLQVTAKWLRSEADAGRVPHVRADRVLLFHAETVEAILVKRATSTNESEVCND